MLTKEGDESKSSYLAHIGGFFAFVALAGLSIIGWGLNHHCWAKKSCCFKEYHNPANIRVFWWMSFIGLCGIFACCVSGFITSYNFANKLGTIKCAYERVYYDSIYGEIQSNSTKWEGLTSRETITESLRTFLVNNENYTKIDVFDSSWVKGDESDGLDPNVYYNKTFVETLKSEVLDKCKQSDGVLRNLEGEVVCDKDLEDPNSIVLKYTSEVTRITKYFSDEVNKINNFIANKSTEKNKYNYGREINITNNKLESISEDFNNYKTNFLDKAYHYINISKALGYILVVVFYSISLAIAVFSCFFLWAYSYFKEQKVLNILMHICWNILKFLALVFFIFGGAFGALYLLSKDLIGYNKFLFGEANLAENATTYLLPNGTTKEFLRYCINEDDGNYMNNIDLSSINLIKDLYYNRKAEENIINNYDRRSLKKTENCYSMIDATIRNLQESGDERTDIPHLIILDFEKVGNMAFDMIEEIYKKLNGVNELRILEGKPGIVEAIDNLGGTVEKLNCSYLKKEIEILYDSLYELSIESRISCALCSCIAFFAEFTVIFYLLVLYHYDNNQFKDESETINTFHKSKNRKFDLESQNEFMDKSRPINMKQNNKKLDIEFNFN